MNVLAVPYYKQTTDYTCGPASLRMCFAYFGIEADEDELMMLLGTNDAFGTEREKMGEAIRSYGLIPYERTDATLADLRHLVEKGMPVIVRFLEEEENIDHYAVVVGIDDQRVIVHDPWRGTNVAYELGKFLMRWPCTHYRGQTCWLLGVSDGHIS